MIKSMIKTASVLVLIFFFACSKSTAPPIPFGATPSERQLAWHDLETYAFLHFTTNTFTDKEWGYGDESPQVFNPTDFDADQIIGTLANTGFKGAILTAKHHDGFCLWPSKYTEHSVKNSPWKDGQGDVVKEIADACRKHGIKFGIYLSPWDRNHADYGTKQYLEYYRNQLRELLTNYGDIFEVWFDGANGGDGYYGGAREERRIDRATYYGWDTNFGIVRELQPHAVIFSDIGPDVRWVGNERGYAADSSWATYTPLPAKGFLVPSVGATKHQVGETGTMNGKFWIPAEADVSIRPGWFYHPSEDEKVKTLEKLKDIYFHSVGNGASLLLNVPLDRTGQIHETDSLRLMEFKQFLDNAFNKDLLQGSRAKANHTRGSDFNASKLVDDDPSSYWATEDEQKSATVKFQLDGFQTFNCMILKEYIPLGQRVTNFSVKVMEDGRWREVANGSTIGHKKIVRFETVTSDKVSLSVEALACPVLSEVKLFDMD